MHNLGWWLVVKPMVDFLFALIELFCYLLWFMSYEAKCVQLGCRRWVDLFAVKFYLNRVVPINHSWHQKTRDTGLLDGEDRIPLYSLVLTQYRSVTDGWTDRRICRSIYSACKALWAIKNQGVGFYKHPVVMIVWSFYSCDIDVDSMTFIHECDLLKMYV